MTRTQEQCTGDSQRRKVAAVMEVVLDGLEAAERLGTGCVSEDGQAVMHEAHEELCRSYFLSCDIWPWTGSSAGEEVPFSPSQKRALERIRQELNGLEEL